MLHLRRASVRSATRRAVAAAAVLAITAGTLLALPAVATAAPTPPPNPTNGQLSAAARARAAANAEVNSRSAAVGQLGGQVAAAESALTALQGTAELAEQNVAYAISKQRDGENKARTAVAANKAAVAEANNCHRSAVLEVQSIYISGQPDGATGALLQAQNPSALLDQSTLTNFIVDNKLDAIGRCARAAVVASNTAAAARLAVQRLKTLTANAQTAQRAAAAAVSLQASRKASLESTLAASQTALVAEQNAFSSAQSRLATLTGQRATYNAYVAYLAEQRRKAAIAAAKARARAAQAARAQAAAAAAAAYAKKHHRKSGGGSSSGGGSGGGSSYSPPVHASGGSWTAARGRAAVARARRTLGTPYAWAGGGSGGPSYGVCDASNGAPNDCYVKGYDCSGLAMFAWGPYKSMDHLARTQYRQAGSYHPRLSQLKPGDLLFWSNGGVSGIHHVAIYIGNGKIIQAPYSGGYVEISSMYDPGTIFGATRPLT